MKKLLLTLILIAANVAVGLPSASALTLSVTPSSGSVAVGGNLGVDLVISDLGSTIGTFDVSIGFNPALLTLNSFALGAGLGNESLGEALTSVNTATAGTINLFEVSLLESSAGTCVFCLPPYLDELQSPSFVLATLSFSGLAAGTSTLTPFVNALGDGDGNDLAAGLNLQSGSVLVGVSPVPEPSTYAMVAVGLIGLMLGKLRLQHRA